MVAYPFLSSEIIYGHLLFIKLPGGEIYRLQNFQLEPFLYQGQTWEFFAFQADGIQNNLELSNTTASISIANHSIVRDLIQTEIRNSRIKLYTIFFEDDNYTFEFSGIISGYSLNKSVITLQVSSPINAITGSIPSSDFNPQDFPILSYINLTRPGKIRQ